MSSFPFRYFFLLFALTAFPPSLPAQTPAEVTPEEVLRIIRSVEERVKRIEAAQQEILAREEKILAELNRIRVWVHRQ